MDSFILRSSKVLLLLVSTFLLLLAPSGLKAGVEEGKLLYQNNCARCHYMDKRFTGPALQNVRSRWPDSTELYAWIRNSQAFLATGDEYANNLYEEYNNSVMPAFLNLSDEDIANILKYIDAWQPPVKETEVAATGGEAEPSNSLLTILVIVVGVLLIIAFILTRVVNYLNRVVREKYEEEIPEPVPIYKRKGLKPFFALGGLVVFCFLCYSLYDGAAALGRQEGYMPDQPIAFSHELHAGINKIDCRYCHTGAEKGKSAVIPSLNVCMNCHYTIQEGTNAAGTKEIEKIYSYIGFDKETLSYTGETKPIEWVRIHNLPDHVYFNHAQHVKVGGIDCQVCHGEVEKMEVVYQAENLSMGFCVNCHRETEVKFASNQFYQSYEKLHEELSTGAIEAVHVEDIGGEECQRCHY